MYYIYMDVGEFEIDFEVQEDNLTLDEAKKVYKEKYNNGNPECGSEVLLCLSLD